MIDKKHIPRFKRAFYGSNPIIQVINDGTNHKIRSLKHKTAKFLEESEIKLYGNQLRFFEAEAGGNSARKALGYEFKGTQPRILFKLPADEVPALEGLYYVGCELHQRLGLLDLGGLVLSSIWPCKSLEKIF